MTEQFDYSRVSKAQQKVYELVGIPARNRKGIVGTLVGLAGSVTTVTAHALGLPSYQRDRIHGAQLPVSDVIDACTDLLLMPRSRRRELPYMHEGRVDVIGAGALVWRTVVQRVAHDSGLATVRASETDILDGIALSQL